MNAFLAADSNLDPSVVFSTRALTDVGGERFNPRAWEPAVGVAGYQGIYKGVPSIWSGGMSYSPGYVSRFVLTDDFEVYLGFEWQTRPATNSYDFVLAAREASTKTIYMTYERTSSAFKFGCTKFTPPSTYTSLGSYNIDTLIGFLQLARVGNTITGYRSTDGSTWTSVGSWDFDATANPMWLLIYTTNWTTNVTRWVSVTELTLVKGTLGRVAGY